MGKKIETSKEVATPAAVEKKPAKAAKVPAKKSVVKKSPASTKKSVKTAFTNDDIALRAYFIAEKRHKTGQPGDSSHDWLEAERQLLAESKKKPVAKTAKKA